MRIHFVKTDNADSCESETLKDKLKLKQTGQFALLANKLASCSAWLMLYDDSLGQARGGTERDTATSYSGRSLLMKRRLVMKRAG